MAAISAKLKLSLDSIIGLYCFKICSYPQHCSYLDVVYLFVVNFVNDMQSITIYPSMMTCPCLSELSIKGFCRPMNHDAGLHSPNSIPFPTPSPVAFLSSPFTLHSFRSHLSSSFYTFLFNEGACGV